MKKIAIIGGGISGLAAAYALEKARLAGSPLEYCVWEASSRAGGVIRSERVEDCVVEAGPDSFLTEKNWAADFCRELGLGDQLIGSRDEQRKTYIYQNKRLMELPDGLAFMVPTKAWPIIFSPLFSWRAKIQMLREWFSPVRDWKGDESVGEFIGRHYGREMIDRVAEPLLAGVYGGSAAQLSAAAVLPRFVEMESKYGSLGKGMIASRKNAQRQAASPIFTSLKNGMQQMVETILKKTPAPALRLNAKVDFIRFENGQWVLTGGGEEERLDAIILAVPAYAAASIMQTAAPELARLLLEIPYSSSITVAMGFKLENLVSLPSGFGFLVPRSEGKRTMAATFVHQKFAHRTSSEMGLVRCFLGGTDEPATRLDDNAIQQIVREELREILGLRTNPEFVRVFRWPKAMAQYTVGHQEQMERIQSLASRLPQFALAGNAYSGIGIPDCIRSGQAAARHILEAIPLH